MRSIVVTIAMAVAMSGCGHESIPPTTSPSVATVVSVSVTGSVPVVGATAPFTAIATFSDGATQNVTSQAAWTSSNASVATVNSAGVVTAVGAGEADITATYQTVAGRSHVAIARPALLNYAITGTVTDGTSGGILPNITVQATDSAGNVKSAVTLSTGAYSIVGLVAGPLTITASAISYQTTRLAITLTGDARVDIVLPRVVCTFTLSTNSYGFPQQGGLGSVSVTSHATVCAWIAQSSDPFITVTSGTGENDTGEVRFSVAPNLGEARTGRLVIAGQAVTVTQQAGTSSCDGNLPVPVLGYTGKDDGTGSTGEVFTYYHLDVLNKSVFPGSLFFTAPDLPPCGLNPNASRTWLEIFANSGRRLYGFCGLQSALQMGTIWFALPKGQQPPDGVYITLTDRRCGRAVASNSVTIR